MLIVYIVVLFLVLVTKSENNVCRNIVDYFNREHNKNCWYNPDFRMKSPDLIKKYAGVFEEHEVTTDDGYIITVFRIPRENPKGVILMVHPLGGDSKMFVFQGNDSLAITLWLNGYDVWLNNQRGSYHSEKHVNLTISDYAYWNWSFHEVGKYDVPSMINLIRSKTGDSKIIFFGYSLGTTVGLTYLTVHAEHASKAVKSAILGSTACYWTHNRNPVLKLAARNVQLIQNIVDVLKFGAVLPFPSAAFIELFRFVTKNVPIAQVIFEVIMMSSDGWTPNDIDPATSSGMYVNESKKQFQQLWSYDIAYLGRNLATKLILHYLQLIRDEDRFQMYDYGIEGNRRLYGMDRPALYPLWNITVPIYMIASKDDALTTLEDAELLYSRLPERAKIYGRLHISGVNHDGAFNKKRVVLFNNNILAFLNRTLG